jgi:hypothetical protein
MLQRDKMRVLTAAMGGSLELSERFSAKTIHYLSLVIACSLCRSGFSKYKNSKGKLWLLLKVTKSSTIGRHVNRLRKK